MELWTEHSQISKPDSHYGTPGPDLASRLMCELHAVKRPSKLWLRPQCLVSGFALRVDSRRVGCPTASTGAFGC